MYESLHFGFIFPYPRLGVGGGSVDLDSGDRVAQYNIHIHLARRIDLVDIILIHHRFPISSVVIPQYNRKGLT